MSFDESLRKLTQQRDDYKRICEAQAHQLEEGTKSHRVEIDQLLQKHRDDLTRSEKALTEKEKAIQDQQTLIGALTTKLEKVQAALRNAGQRLGETNNNLRSRGR